MTDAVVIECDIAFPSIARALELTPPEFEQGYRWFRIHQGQVVTNLPFGKGRPSELDYPLARQSGIHSPSEQKMHYRAARYAISVHSSDLKRYPDKKPIDLGDGTWVFDYSSQDNSLTKTRQDYNGWLMNCLEDGIPVGVMTKLPTGGYMVWGLAFVERYNSISKMFTLHGPVDAVNERLGRFAFTESSSLTNEDRIEISRGTEAERRFVRRLQRFQQDTFREKLLDAYGYRCAISDANVPEGLQAAHIEPYRGIRSQRVSNGILLRADIHLLYDAHLLSVTPGNHVVRMSDRLRDTPYNTYNGRKIRVPRDTTAQPDDDLLEKQFVQFRNENTLLALDWY